MKIKTLGLLLALALGSLAGEPRPGWAYEDYLNSLANRVGITLNLGGSSYAMADENNYIDHVNQDLSGNVGKLNGGASFDLGLCYGFTENFLIGLDYGVLGAYARGTFPGDGTYEVNLPATEAGGYLKLALPIGDQLLVGVAAGLYSLRVYHGTEIITAPGLHDTLYSDGWATSYKLFGSAEFFLTEGISLGVNLGYRWARINEVRDEHSALWTKSDGSNFTLDYSGAFGKGGVRFYF